MQKDIENNKTSKFLVCVSASPSSAKIIEWTAKTAKAFNAKWVALYIETPNTLRLGEIANEHLKSNITLAKSLGAEFIQIEGYNVASSVAEYSKQADITNIVIGKSRNRKTLRNFFEKSLEEQIIDRLGNIEVHIVPDTDEKNNFHEPKAKSKFIVFDILKSIVFLLIATGICFLFKALNFNEVNFILIYTLTVIITSIFTQGYIYGICSTVVGVLLFDFFFVEPYFAFHPIDTDYIFRLVTMSALSIMMGMITSKIKTRSVRAVKREKYLEDLHALSQKIIKVRGYTEIMEMLTDYFSTTLKLNIHIYNNEDANEIVEQVFLSGRTAGKFTKTHPELNTYYVPVKTNDKVLAVLGIDCENVENLDENERTFIKMATAQFALALEKELLHDSQEQALISIEKEKTRSNLLRSVSHDLRTPLTAIYGSASTIANENLDKATVKTLAENICEDSNWLIRMVENLLLVTKINSGSVSLKTQLEAVEEIIAEAVAKVKARDSEINIKVAIPDELLLVHMDGMLIEQVILNLLDNSVKHSGTDIIEIKLTKEENNAVITVSDKGKGISEKEILAIEKGTAEGNNNVSDGKKGMGIGLSLCHTIIKAHNGKIIAKNKTKGGAEFSIILPIGEQNNE